MYSEGIWETKVGKEIDVHELTQGGFLSSLLTVASK